VNSKSASLRRKAIDYSVQAIYCSATTTRTPLQPATLRTWTPTTQPQPPIVEPASIRRRPLALSRILDPRIVGAEIRRARAGEINSASATRTSRTSIAISYRKNFPTKTSHRGARAPDQKFLSQPMFVARSSPPRRKRFVKIQDTVRSFKEIVEAKIRHVPEQAFYKVGTIDEALRSRKDEARRLITENASEAIDLWSSPPTPVAAREKH